MTRTSQHSHDLTTLSTFDHVGRADVAYDRLTGFAAVLSRFAEMQEADHSNPDGARVDFGTRHEDEFWCGVRLMQETIIEDANTLHAAVRTLNDEARKGGGR